MQGPNCLTRLEKQNCDLTDVEVDEMLGLVGDIRSEVATNNAVPGGAVLLVKLLLDVSCNILFDVELLQSLSCTIDCILLHVLRHVSILDDCSTSLCHFEQTKTTDEHRK
mgnify:CR=1 FL=1